MDFHAQVPGLLVAVLPRLVGAPHTLRQSSDLRGNCVTLRNVQARSEIVNSRELGSRECVIPHASRFRTLHR